MEEVAVETAKKLASGELRVDRTKKGLVDKVMNHGMKYEFFRNFILNKARQQVMKMSGGLYPAPLKVPKIMVQLVF